MKRNEVQARREQALSRILLRRFRSHLDDIPLPELFELFKGEPMLPETMFNVYASMTAWVKRLPGVTVEYQARSGRRGQCVLRMDAEAAMFAGAKTGESMHIDFQALRQAPEFEPVGDSIFSRSNRQEAYS